MRSGHKSCTNVAIFNTNTCHSEYLADALITDSGMETITLYVIRRMYFDTFTFGERHALAAPDDLKASIQVALFG